MTKIEEIEKLLEGWKAARQEREEDGHTKVVIEYTGIIRGLTAALGILGQPSNTQIHMDTKPCGYCKRFEETPLHFNYCGHCGRVLSQ